jgi:eukaryotic-like serine/threonine-protein kinase
MLNSEAVAEPVSASSGRIAPFGKYLLLQRVSVGGMAEVFKALPATADRIDQIVAIKRILPNIAEDSEFIGMFIDEARIAGQLTHPNICRIYELGRVNNDHYIAMQFLWGRDLLKLMNRYKKAGRFVSPLMAAFIGSKACSALHYAHNKRDENGQPLNIIHRDVSPQNIIVGYSGQVKLIDFGVARAASQSQKTQAGILKGKFGYMSPEMIRGMEIDHRSDVFAMGICLHELLTSARLFYGETDFATLELVRDANVAPPSHKSPGVPPALDAIVMKALSREVADRFQSAEEMQLALEEFLARHDPQFGQTDVGLAMRQAFHTEVQRERERLELFWGMLERGELVRGAAVPSLQERGDSGERSAAPSPVSALLGAAETPDPELRQAEDERAQAAQREDHGADDELQDEQTHIFFSAHELDEIRDLDSNAVEAAPRKATLSDMVPPPPAGAQFNGYPQSNYPPVSLPPPDTRSTFGSAFPSATDSSSGFLPREEGHTPAPASSRDSYAPSAASSGGFRPSAVVPRGATQQGAFATQPGNSVFDQAYQWPSAAQAQYESPLDRMSSAETIQAPPRRSPRLLRAAVLSLLALTVVVATYALPRFANAGTGALEVGSVDDPDALVRVDGIVRGNPPLVVEGLEPGIHSIEIEAAGFEIARADVQVEKGQARPIKMVLERARNKPEQGTAAVANAPQQTDTKPEITELPPTPEKPSKERTRVPATPGHPRATGAAQSARTAELNAESKTRADELNEGGGENETQVAEDLDEEMAAANEGSLLISTVPWSHVFVDGEDTGRDTPVRALRVAPGKHKIGLRTPDEVTHTVEVEVEAGQVVRIIRRF